MDSIPAGWAARAQDLATLGQRQLFFVGGAPRSGTTWLQQMLDAHPQVACRGEGLFLHQLAVPLERMLKERERVIGDKNRTLFTHTGGFPQLAAGDSEHLLGTAILLALARYAPGPECRALGEKTPENVFFFPRLQSLFPAARFIAIVRDPRDVLSSAWHYFGRPQGSKLAAFVEAALPAMASGLRAMLAFAAASPHACCIVTYEALRADPAPELARLFALLGVVAAPALLADIVARTDFAAATGRAAGVTQEGSFHRSGVVGQGRATMPAEVNAIILQALGWAFPRFGWEP